MELPVLTVLIPFNFSKVNVQHRYWCSETRDPIDPPLQQFISENSLNLFVSLPVKSLICALLLAAFKPLSSCLISQPVNYLLTVQRLILY